MSKVKVTASGLVGAWALSCVAAAPISYWWGREASDWEPPPPGLIQGAETNEMLTVLPYALARFGLLMLLVTGLLVATAYWRREPERRRQ
ncbi:hypothetical protein [Streptomyces sp. NPDC003635]